MPGPDETVSGSADGEFEGTEPCTRFLEDGECGCPEWHCGDEPWRDRPRRRLRHSGPDTKFCVLCQSGEHERVERADLGERLDQLRTGTGGPEAERLLKRLRKLQREVKEIGGVDESEVVVRKVGDPGYESAASDVHRELERLDLGDTVVFNGTVAVERVLNKWNVSDVGGRADGLLTDELPRARNHVLTLQADRRADVSRSADDGDEGESADTARESRAAAVVRKVGEPGAVSTVEVIYRELERMDEGDEVVFNGTVVAERHNGKWYVSSADGGAGGTVTGDRYRAHMAVRKLQGSWPEGRDEPEESRATAVVTEECYRLFPALRLLDSSHLRPELRHAARRWEEAALQAARDYVRGLWSVHVSADREQNDRIAFVETELVVRKALETKDCAVRAALQLQEAVRK